MRGPLGRITRVAGEVAAGRLDQQPFGDASSDEVGQLGRAFDVMLESIHTLMGAQETAAGEERSRLDRVVRARTQELDERNAAVKNILDHVPVALLTVDGEGRLRAECSLGATCIFGAPEPDQLLWDYLSIEDGTFGVQLELAWAQITDGFLPIEVALDQLPR